MSLAVLSDGRVVGHILFTPVNIQTAKGEIQGMGLAPMAVVPERQRQGVGSQLVEAGLKVLRQRACPFVIVLGHHEYYSHFGFVPASRHGLACQWERVPDDAFMVLILDEAFMAGVAGVAFTQSPQEQARLMPRGLNCSLIFSTGIGMIWSGLKNVQAPSTG